MRKEPALTQCPPPGMLPRPPSPRGAREPDIIVVGGGAAGSALAARLTERPDIRVLLLEAGPDYPGPSKFPEDLLNPDILPQSHDWGYQSDPGTSDYPVPVTRGKVIGGSTSLNAAVAGRGLPGDYDEWAMLGNPGWSHADLLGYFRRVEDDPAGDAGIHGRGGPVPVRRDTGRLTELHRAFLEAARNIGFPEVDDVDGGRQPEGAGVLGRNVLDGIRVNGALAYLDPARHRENLEIRGDAECDRILIHDGSARGVVLTSGETLRGGQVVLCAGTYGSPAVLLRSGIGPREELGALGIRATADIPGVGRGLAEQPFFFTVYAADPARLGRLTPPAQVILRTGSDAGLPRLHIIPNTYAPQEMSPTGAAFAISVALLRTRSRGRVRLASRDPLQPPLIDLQLLSDPADARDMADGVRLARRLSRTEPLAYLGLGELFPGDDAGDPDLQQVLREHAGIYNHASGTVRMGPPGDPLAVVGPDCRVRGVDGLTVADASVIPVQLSGVTALTVAAIAEKVAACMRASPAAR